MLVFPFSISFLEFPQKAWKAWWSKSGQRAWSLESDLAQPWTLYEYLPLPPIPSPPPRPSPHENITGDICDMHEL